MIFSIHLYLRLMRPAATYRFLLPFLFVFTGLTVQAQSITGVSTIYAGASTTYTLTDDAYANQNWTVSSGTIQSQTHSGVNHSVTLYFDCAGTQTVYFMSGSLVINSKQVTVNPTKFLDVPATTFTYSVQCGYTVITRNSNPPNGISWYWSAANMDTNLSMGSGTSINVTTAGTYYLRARGTITPCNWSTASQATAYTDVHVIPNVSAYSGTTCSGTLHNSAHPLTGINNPNGVAGTTFSWVVASATNVTGAFADSGNYIAQTLSCTDGVSAGSVTYTITPSANGCSGTPQNVTFTVSPLAQITNLPASPSICSGTALNFTPSLNMAGTYSWTSSVSGSISSISSSGSGSITNTPVNTGNVPGTVTYHITPYNSVSCSGTIKDYTVTVMPVPGAAATGAQSLCSGQTSAIALSSSNGVSGSTYSWSVASAYVSGASAGSGSSIAQILTTTTNSSGTVTYTVTALANGCSGPPVTAAITVNPVPDITSSPSQLQDEICSGAALNFIPSSSVGGTTYTWTGSGDGNVSGYTSGNGVISNTLTNTSTGTGVATYQVTPSSSGCVGTPKTYSVTVVPVPQVNFTGSSILVYGNPVQLSTTASGMAAYQWRRDGTSIAGASQPTWQVQSGGAYTLAIKGTGSGSDCVSNPVSFTPAMAAQPIPVNMVSTTRILKEGMTTASPLYTLTATELVQTISYQDAMGRTFQSIGVGLSPEQGDMVMPIAYGELALVDTTFLPYTTTTRDGRLRLNSIRTTANGYAGSEQQQFYQNAVRVVHDDVPFARTLYRNAPDARVTEQGGPGISGQPGGHTVKNTITLNTISYPVRYWKPDGTSTANYPVNTVVVTIGTDENGNQIRSFTDALGHVVLKQVQLDETVSGTMVNWLDTYYIYNALGQLIYQLPPKAISILGTGPGITASSSTVSELIYKYVYDSKGRLIEKKVPGAALQYIVYDNLDRIALTQDGTLRAGNNWMFIKYDYQNRPVYSGLYQNTTQTTRPTVQALFDAIDYSTAPFYEAEQANATYQGYSNNVFPTAGLTLMSANYYDHYDFDRNGTADYSYDNTHLAGIPAAASTATRGLTTGSKKATIDEAGAITANLLTSVVFYDSYDRAIQTLSNNHLNLTLQDKSSVLYDFAGHALKTHTTHVGTTTVNTTSRSAHDHAWRTTGVFQEVEEPVTWTALNVQVTGNTVTKTTTTTAWDAGALSQNSIASGQDGWVEFHVNGIDTYKMLGLSAYNTDPSYESINYAIHTAASGQLVVYESGTAMAVISTAYAATDVFRVERKAGIVYYKINGQVFYTSAVASSGTLYADAAIYSTSASLVDVHLSSGGDKQLAAYEYNALGQVVDKKLHNTGGSNFLQSIDYRYDIKGQLLSINNAQLVNDGVTNDDPDSDRDDYFGIELMYNTTDAALGNTAYYNGNISALKWKGMGGGSGAADQRSYKYNYDKSDRLKDAAFQAYGSSAWDKEANTLNENMTYDVNGNVATLTRKQNQRGLSGLTVTSTAQAIDNLSYTYTTGNQISKVEDSGTTAGFNNGVVNGATEYTYATDGSLTKDDNKGISAIAYNMLGKPKQVTFTNGNVITYTYAADGSKLKMATTVNNVTTTTDYAGNYVYTNNILSFFGSPEGRVVKNGSSYDYQYAIADHQGNTRVVFSSATPVAQPVVADFEATANSGVQNYPAGGSRSSLNLYDHSDAGSTYTYSQLLNAGYSSQVGVAKSYKVYPGDKVKIEAYAKFSNPTSTSSNVSAFASALLSAFGVPAPASGEVGTISSALNSWGGLVAGGSGGGSSGPKAFVNIIVFDKDYKFLDAAYEAVDPNAQQVGVSPNIAHDYMSREYVAKEAGYVFMYISNENSTQVDVYFDDVTMTYTPGNIIQYNEYYPFGLQTAQSWTRENNTGNNFLANSGTELNTVSNLYDLDYRNYDPVLGRMNGVDPMANMYSSLTPYNFSFNDPVAFTDPNGADPNCPTCGCMICGNDDRSGSAKFLTAPSQWSWMGDPAGAGTAWMGPSYDPESGQHSMAERDNYGEWGHYFIDPTGSTTRSVVATLRFVTVTGQDQQNSTGPEDGFWDSFVKWMNEPAFGMRHVTKEEIDADRAAHPDAYLKLDMAGTVAGFFTPGGFVKSAAGKSSMLPQIGNKLLYLFGKASGNAHNIERSTVMARQLSAIGVFDDLAGNAYLRGHLGEVLNSTQGILQSNGRVLRESLLMGPNGSLKMESIWEGTKLITVKLMGQ